ncbi:cytochrome c2 [Labrenzia sp. EL_126]|nr:cytochrome c2 [Labrenzia sp. EL_126]
MIAPAKFIPRANLYQGAISWTAITYMCGRETAFDEASAMVKSNCSVKKQAMPSMKIPLLLLFLVFWSSAGGAQQIDPHALYERACSGCHAAHAGEFVFEVLENRENDLVSRMSHRPVSAVLETGHGGLSAAEVDVLADLFSDISRSGRLFFRKCRICHVSAKVLARRKLVIRDGRLIGRYSDQIVSQYLMNHGRLNADEIPTMVEVLTRQITTKAETQD